MKGTSCFYVIWPEIWSCLLQTSAPCCWFFPTVVTMDDINWYKHIETQGWDDHWQYWKPTWTYLKPSSVQDHPPKLAGNGFFMCFHDVPVDGQDFSGDLPCWVTALQGIPIRPLIIRDGIHRSAWIAVKSHWITIDWGYDHTYQL